MADVKWIKIVTDIFDDEKFQLIDAMHDADSIELIWFKLLVLAGKTNQKGTLVLGDRLAYTDEMLAAIFHRPLEMIRRALSVFIQLSMVEILEGVYSIPNWEKYQSAEGLDKIREQSKLRMRNYRQREREKRIGQNTCAYCGGEATGVDHIIPLSKGGMDDEENTVPCCLRCNMAKTSSSLKDFLDRNYDFVNMDLVRSNEKLMRHVTECYATKRNDVTHSSISISYSSSISQIIDYLNNKLNTNYRSTSKDTKKHIEARLKEGFTLEDFFTVIDYKCEQWGKDPKMSEYLRPQTLFGSKFESYLQSAPKKKKAPVDDFARCMNEPEPEETEEDFERWFNGEE